MRKLRKKVRGDSGLVRRRLSISINNQVIHGVPSKKRIVKDGDIISLDIGLNLKGYISDSTHTVLVGNVKPAHQKLCRVTRECLLAGIDACKAGNRISDISNAVYDIAYNQNKYGVVYEYCGHGVGLEVHEDPSVCNCPSTGPNPRIQAGMVLAIEPMINSSRQLLWFSLVFSIYFPRNSAVPSGKHP